MMRSNNDTQIITVIVPVYNVEMYVRECVDSIINQTYQNLEIILCDDGSTDNCGNICDEYAKKDSRIVVIHKNNGGLSDARNAALDIATGAYITFVDSDDYIKHDMIEYLYSNLRFNDADLAVCQKQIIGKNNTSANRSIKEKVINNNFECMREFIKGKGIDTVAWGKLYKTILFNDIRYPAGKYHEDVYTTYKIISKCSSIFVGGKAEYCYRVREASISTENFSIKHLDAVYGKVERSNFIKDNYPSLIKWANGGIIYSANKCILKYASSKEEHHKDSKGIIIEQLQPLYRKYELDYLLTRGHIVSKMLSVLAYINVSNCIAFIRLINCSKFHCLF